jgi:hypothetical protein
MCSQCCVTWQTDAVGLQKCDLCPPSHLSLRQLQQYQSGNFLIQPHTPLAISHEQFTIMEFSVQSLGLYSFALQFLWERNSQVEVYHDALFTTKILCTNNMFHAPCISLETTNIVSEAFHNTLYSKRDEAVMLGGSFCNNRGKSGR